MLKVGDKITEDISLIDKIKKIGNNIIILPELEDRITKSNALLFYIGAGLSVEFGYKTWNQFLRFMADKFIPEDSIDEFNNFMSATKYEESLQEITNNADKDYIDLMIKNEFGESNLRESALLEETPIKLILSLAKELIITTNYDRVIESVSKENNVNLSSNILVGIKPSGIREALNNDILSLLKIHGDYKEKADRIISNKEYDSAYGQKIPYDGPLAKQLYHLFSNRSILFIGCSLSVDRPLEILKQVRKDNKEFAHKHFALLREYEVNGETDTDGMKKRAKELAEFNILPIWYPFNPENKSDHSGLKTILQYLQNVKDSNQIALLDLSKNDDNKLITILSEVAQHDAETELKTLKDLNFDSENEINHISVKNFSFEYVRSVGEDGKNLIKYNKNVTITENTSYKMITEEDTDTDSNTFESGISLEVLNEIYQNLTKDQLFTLCIISLFDKINQETLNEITTSQGVPKSVFVKLFKLKIIKKIEDEVRLPQSHSIESIIIDKKLKLMVFESEYLKDNKANIESNLISILDKLESNLPKLFLLRYLTDNFSKLNQKNRLDLQFYFEKEKENPGILFFLSRILLYNPDLSEIGIDTINRTEKEKITHQVYYNFAVALINRDFKESIIQEEKVTHSDVDILKGFVIELKQPYDKKIDSLDLILSYLENAIEINDRDSGYLATYAIVHLLEKNYEKAILIANRGLEIDEKNVQCNNILALGFLFIRNFSEAKKFAEITYKLNRKSFSNLTNLITIYTQLKMYDQIVEIILSDLNFIENYKIKTELAIAYERLGKIEESEKLFDEVIEINPDYEKLWLGYGDLITNNYPNLDDKALQYYKKAVLVNNKSINGLIAIGIILAKRGDFNFAEEYIEKAIELGPSSDYALLNLANYFANKSNFEKARYWLNNILKYEPTNLPANTQLALIDYYEKKYENGVANLEKLVQSNPLNEDAYYILALNYMGMKNYQKAENGYKHLLMLNSKSLEYKLGLIQTYIHLNKLQQANELYSEFQSLIDKDSNIAHIGGILQSNLQNQLEAVKLYEKAIEINPKNYFSWINLINLFLNENNFIKAKAYLQLALKEFPNDFTLINKFTKVLTRLKEYKEALDFLNNFDKNQLNIAINLFDVYISSGMEKETELIFNNINKLDPNSIKVNLAFSEFLMNHGRIDEAKKLQKNIIKRNVKDSRLGSIYFNISQILLRNGDSKNGMRNLNLALKRDKSNYVYFLAKGKAFLQENNFIHAKKNLKKFLEIYPEDKNGLFHLGISYLKSNDKKQFYSIFNDLLNDSSTNKNIIYEVGEVFNQINDVKRTEQAFDTIFANEFLNIQKLSRMGDFYKNKLKNYSKAIMCYEKAIKAGRNDSLIKIVLAGCYIFISQQEKSLQLCNEILEQEPTNESALIQKGVLLATLGDKDVEKIIKTLSTNIEHQFISKYMLALYYDQINDIEMTIKTSIDGLSIETKNQKEFLLNMFLGINYKLQGESELSKENFVHAEKKFNKFYLDLIKTFGVEYFNKKLFEKAQVCFIECLKIKEDDEECMFYLGLTFKKMEKYEKSEKLMKKAIEIGYSNYSFYYELGDLYKIMKKPNDALQIFKLLQEKEIDPPRYWNASADIYLLLLKDYEKAIEYYKNSLDVDDSNWKVHQNISIAYKFVKNVEEENYHYELTLKLNNEKLDVYKRECEVYQELHDFILLKELVEQYLLEYNDDSGLLYYYGISLYELNETSDAKKMFIKIIENEKSDHLFMMNIGEFYFKRKKYDDAKFFYEMSLENDPKDFFVLNRLGFANIKLNNLSEAEQYLNKALNVNNIIAVTWYNLACVESLKNNDIEKAIEFLEKAINLDDESKKKAKEDSDFDNIKENPKFRELVIDK